MSLDLVHLQHTLIDLHRACDLLEKLTSTSVQNARLEEGKHKYLQTLLVL